MSTPKPPDDAILTARACQGDREAFRLLYERYARRVFAFLLGYTGQRETAEDLTQEVFLRAWQSLPHYREQGEFLAWLFRIARNLLTDRHRRRRLRLLPWSHLEAFETERIPGLTHAGADPEAALLRGEAASALHIALSQLHPAQREVLLLRFFAGLSVSETAQVMGRSEGSVRVLQHRALQHLRHLLQGQEDGGM